jgi:tRNA U38,U39,U40 pseudouridine synthase TruA
LANFSAISSQVRGWFEKPQDQQILGADTAEYYKWIGNYFYAVGDRKLLEPTNDIDKDGLTNQDEFIMKTNPILPDSDGDGFSDGIEVINSTNVWGAGAMPKGQRALAEKLDITAMKRASEYFIGAHDFTAFSNAKSKKKSMVREIYEIDFEEADGFLNIRLRGDGFLYNMERWIVGTLIDIGLGKINAEQIPAMLEDKDRGRTGNLAKACGLYLEKVTY